MGAYCTRARGDVSWHLGRLELRIERLSGNHSGLNKFSSRGCGVAFGIPISWNAAKAPPGQDWAHIEICRKYCKPSWLCNAFSSSFCWKLYPCQDRFGVLILDWSPVQFLSTRRDSCSISCAFCEFWWSTKDCRTYFGSRLRGQGDLTTKASNNCFIQQSACQCFFQNSTEHDWIGKLFDDISCLGPTARLW